MYRMWDKSRCDPYNRPGHGCDGNMDVYELPIPDVPNIVSITNILSPTANVKIESPRIPIDYYMIYIKMYKTDGTYMGITEFKTSELTPNIPTKDFIPDHIYKVYAVAHNEAGESGRSKMHKIDTTTNHITDYPVHWYPPGDIDVIICERGIGCGDTLVCN